MIISARDLKFDPKKDKGIMFFSAGSPKDCEMLFKVGIYDILVSYFYLRKRKRQFQEEILPEIKAHGGLFMTDSGGYSFAATSDIEKMMSGETWKEYLNEYVQWLWDWREYIFSAVNLDIDGFVGRDTVDYWNLDLFVPLERVMEISYVVHPLYPHQVEFDYTDKYGINRAKEYFKAFDYVGINPEMLKMQIKIYEMSKLYKKRIHGFGWTSIPILRRTPFASIDSTTWLGGQRYGTSYIYDGANFFAYAGKSWKHLRVKKKVFCEMNNVDYAGVLKDKRDPVNELNLHGWLGARKIYLKVCNQKLTWSEPAANYIRTDKSVSL